MNMHNRCSERSVGKADTVIVDDTIRLHAPLIVAATDAASVRRVKNEDRFYPILILILLLYVAYITPPHRHNLQQNAFLP